MTATGDLTIHGVTRPVELLVEAHVVDEAIVVAGSLDLTFSDYGVEVVEPAAVPSELPQAGQHELQLEGPVVLSRDDDGAGGHLDPVVGEGLVQGTGDDDGLVDDLRLDEEFDGAGHAVDGEIPGRGHRHRAPVGSPVGQGDGSTEGEARRGVQVGLEG